MESFVVKSEEGSKIVKRGKEVAAKLSNLIASGLTIYYIHSLSPLAVAKEQLMAEQPKWKKDGTVFCEALNLAIGKVLKQKKP